VYCGNSCFDFYDGDIKMNERIKELMVELKKTVSTHRGAEVLIGYDEIEKFAELILRECKLFCGHDSEGVSAMFKHFGVEE
jgi:hypothetical protein